MTNSTKKINRFDSFTRLRSVILGDINWSLCDIIEDPVRKNYTQEMLADLSETFQHFDKILRSFDIHIDRPKIIPYDKNKTYVTPYFDVAGIKSPVTPSDSFLCLANTVVEVPSVQESSFFDYVQYKHIWQEYFDNGSQWISAPRPMYHPDQYDNEEYYLEWAEPLFDGPCVEPIGNVAFHSESFTLNKRARMWLERTFPEFQFIEVNTAQSHLDGYFRVLRPGLLLSAIPKNKLPNHFAKWDVIHAEKMNYTPPEIVSEFLQDDDYENTTLEVNGLSIDEDNFVFMKHQIDYHPKMVKQIESYGINVIPLPFDSSRFLNQGINCIVNTTCRDGKLENYFT